MTWAVETGITAGTSATTFSPDAPVTWQEAGVFLYRMALAMDDLSALPSTGGEVTHGTIASWAQTECIWALDRGLFTETRGAMSTPSAAIPRSALAATLDTYRQLVQ